MSKDFLTERGINPGGEVAQRRGYAPYQAGDVDAVYEAAGWIMDWDAEPRNPDEPRSGRRNPDWVEKFTRSPGWVIPKHRVFEHLPHIRPQLRPDEAVVEKVWEHDHSGNAVDSEGRPLSPFALAQHVDSPNRRKVVEVDGVEYRQHLDVRRKHKRHWHVETAKYGIAPEEDKILADGGRWLYDDSKRLDHNPVSDFSQPGPVFLGIEGTPKNDAMVEWLLAHGRAAKVVNVPGVSMWRAPELALFAVRHMRGWPAVIVPDADWVDNDEVIYHAENALLYLLNVCGVRDVVVAAPPVGFGRKPDDKGVDDWLGPKYNGSLDELQVIRRALDPAALAGFEDEYRSHARARGAKRKTVNTDLHVAKTAGRTSGRAGTTLRHVSALTRAAYGRAITEEEALIISRPESLPRWGNPVARLYAHIRRANDEFSKAQEESTYRALERLEGVAFEATGTWPDWVEPHWETVGWRDATPAEKKRARQQGRQPPKKVPRRVRKRGSPGSRIEFVSMDERLRMRELEPVPLGEHLERARRAR